MTPEERDLLTETHRLVQENAETLQQLRRHQRMTSAVKAFYWIIVIALSLGAYYVIKPYVDTLKASVGEITGTTTTLDR